TAGRHREGDQDQQLPGMECTWDEPEGADRPDLGRVVEPPGEAGGAACQPVGGIDVEPDPPRDRPCTRQRGEVDVTTCTIGSEDRGDPTAAAAVRPDLSAGPTAPAGAGASRSTHAHRGAPRVTRLSRAESAYDTATLTKSGIATLVAI